MKSTPYILLLALVLFGCSGSKEMQVGEEQVVEQSTTDRPSWTNVPSEEREGNIFVTGEISRAKERAFGMNQANADGIQKNLPEPLNLRFWLAPLFAFPRLTLLGTVIMAGVAAIGIHHLRYDFNLLHLQPVGMESIELENKLFNQSNRSACCSRS